MNILILAAHPDDEVIGMGGTIKKLSKSNKIHLCVVSDGASAQYSDKKMIEERKNACKKSGKILGISNYTFLDFPDMKLDMIPHVEINKKLEKLIKKINPRIVYTTPNNDLNKDHQKVFESTLVVTRPHSSNVNQVLSYEFPGLKRKTSTVHNVYEDISKEFSYKVKAFKMYKSEVENFPHPRSLASIESFAIQRGVESNTKKAEAFELIRLIK
ncbi:MAG: hypothetical protein CL763_08330 [Chloroflexi bacterium]|nr:hypothetical protein [Chloroflexota bacterium]|tara:strand:+ start:20167 stop:20808 length:642 start_codon:yes stop_codon:yes gene_type:complete